MVIANNELWLKSTDGTELAMKQNTGWEQTLTGTRLTDDGWTVFTFDADVTVIGTWAFASKPVQAIIFPDTLKTIGASAFKSCPLTDFDLTFPDNVKEIGDSAFYETGIRSVDLNNVDIIGDHAFARVGRLGNVEFPSTVTSIGGGAFAYSSITGIKFNENPEKTLDIGVGAFQYCQNLTGEITFADYEYGLYLGEGAFTGSYINSIVIPDSVTTLRRNLFLSCPNLTKVVIGSGVTSVELGVFANCKNLDKIEIHTGMGEAPTFVAKTAGSGYGLGTFERIKIGGTLYFPNSISYYFRDWLAGEEYDLGYYGWNGVNEFAPALGTNIPSEVVEETDYQITITYPTGNELTFDYPDGVNITLGEAVDNGNGTTTVTGTLRVDEEYEDDTADITISDGETSITKTISITEKEITMPNPTITFQRGFNLTFPQTGRTETITVVYEYTTEGRINDPYSSVWGVNITKGEPVVSGDSITITYSISVPATTYAIDTIPLIFSCVGVNGSSCTETLYGNQEGTSRDNGDECYVNLDSYAHVFPSSGGTVYINADFCKPVVGEGLSVRVMNSNGVYPISWCRAELKGGGIDDDGFEGHETWAIIMDSSEFTEPFTALITFSYTNTYGDSASATFTAIREAAAGEPESFDPEIQPYVTQLWFKADGSNDIQNMDYLQVMYQDFATGVINNPISDVGWFRIVETVKQEETEDGILMRYYYEVDANELTVPRTGELKLSGVVAGVQYSTSVPFTQARAETTDDGGDDDGDDTGDIPIIEGTYIGQIWKDVEFDFGNQNPVSYSIWMGDEMIYSGKSYMRPGQGSNKILVNKIVQDYLVQPQLDLDAVSWYINGKEFTLRNADGSRISHTYRFINDWSYSDDFKTGNLSHPILNKQRAVRGQMYPFSIYGAGEQVSIEYGVTYMDGFVDEFGREIEDWWSTEYITNGVSTDFFRVARRDVEWIESVTVGDDTYYPEEPCAIPYVIYYVNPWGGFDWFPVTGKVTIKDSLTQYSYTKNYNNTKLGFGNSRYLTSIERNYEVNTGWMTQAESERMWYLLESNVVYLHDIKADKIYPVLIKDTEVEHKKRSGSQKLINNTFTCQLSHNRKRQ